MTRKKKKRKNFYDLKNQALLDPIVSISFLKKKDGLTGRLFKDETKWPRSEDYDGIEQLLF